MRYRLVLTVLFSLIFLAGITSITLGAYFTINANDAAVDGSWSGTPLVADINEVGINDEYDVKGGWIVTDDAVVTEVAYLIEFYASPANTAYTDFYGIQIDCDDDAAYNGAADLLFLYDLGNDEPHIVLGDLSNDYIPSVDQAENIHSGGYFIEARYTRTDAVNAGLANEWDACFSENQNVQFVSYLLDGGLIERDSTTEVGYDFPTVVDVTDVRSNHRMTLHWMILGGLAAITLGVSAKGWLHWNR